MTRGDAGPAIPPIFRIDGQEFVGAVLSRTSRGVAGHAAAKTEEDIGDLTLSFEIRGRLPRGCQLLMPQSLGMVLGISTEGISTRKYCAHVMQHSVR